MLTLFGHGLVLGMGLVLGVVGGFLAIMAGLEVVAWVQERRPPNDAS